ncbi:DUF3180 domain-containing protein [Marinitenerispora sediminis]|uniref:DUF3180 domain-containing protein n=1 Tax=Marinitenerispora sediminis TaxID=1931232 RepID=A0A368T9W9_9ACTN|nr:DUF3180 domain-containing protein [Marinitenerispora sediminis]RCV55156.1 DUF3180 domain-containing protein [Marinitenerispora sediminis]RCV61242.1 DUF3180 domain-containing protein [Marinitenerispora sediminis]RCV61513.1 DUF3180 domain-containing protein [Marinitenerispora sediminis]
MGQEHQDDPQGRLHPTGWRLPLGLIVVSGMVGFLVVRQFYGALPVLPWTAIPTLSLLGIGEIVTAVHIRRRIRRVPGTEPVEPISVARLVALAKASAVFGSLVIGLFGGMALALVDRLSMAAPRADAATAAGTGLAAVLLLAAALLLENACRVPTDKDRDRHAPE